MAINQAINDLGAPPLGAAALAGWSAALWQVLRTEVSSPGEFDVSFEVGWMRPFLEDDSTPPAGWLFCYGQEISRTLYADLFAVIGTNYGDGDMSTTYNLPDMRGRTIVGMDNLGGVSADLLTDAQADVLGGTLGAETVTLTIAEMPAHDHDYSRGSSDQQLDDVGPPGTNLESWAGTVATTSTSTGSGDPHDNVQPSIALPWIIKY